jgi:hypothetical protein
MKAKLRVCASCEWIFNRGIECPKCGFGSYSARYVYGNKCYRYKSTQKPWKNRRIAEYIDELNQEIYKSSRNIDLRKGCSESGENCENCGDCDGCLEE